MTGGIAKVVIFSFTERGTKQNRYIYRKLKMQGYICEGYAPAKYVMGEEGGVKQLPKKKEDLIRERWGKWAFLFIGAAGIAVRYIAPYVKDKFTDSAVVVADEAGQYVIPLLSGHVGGAAELADQIANLLGAVSVHTTATDVRKKFAADVFAKKNALYITDREAAKRISAAVLDGELIGIYAQGDHAENAVKNSKEMFSDEVCICNTIEEVMKYRYRVILADSFPAIDENTLLLKPKNIIVGLGCRKGISEELLEKGLLESERIDVMGFSDNMPELISAADLIISRAGALSMSEINVAGKPSILIPFPWAADNHQYYNAKSVSDRGGAILIEEKDIKLDKIIDIIKKYKNNPEKLKKMGEFSLGCSTGDATEKIWVHIAKRQ